MGWERKGVGWMLICRGLILAIGMRGPLHAVAQNVSLVFTRMFTTELVISLALCLSAGCTYGLRPGYCYRSWSLGPIHSWKICCAACCEFIHFVSSSNRIVIDPLYGRYSSTQSAHSIFSIGPSASCASSRILSRILSSTSSTSSSSRSSPARFVMCFIPLSGPLLH